jgi:hypothetical protein
VSLAYPLTITFGLETISKRIRVTDANGQLVVLAHQRATWVKEDVRVFADDQETQPAYRLKGRDPFGLTYSIETFDGRLLGALKLAGSNALSFSPYDVVAASGEVVAHIHAADRWVSLAEQFLGDIPIVDYLVFALLKPTYLFDDASGTTMLRLRVMPSVGQRWFRLDEESMRSPKLDALAVPAALIVSLMVRGDH